MKKDYKTPSCDVIRLSLENCLLGDSITETTKDAKVVNDGGELSSRGANSCFDDDD